MAGYFKRTFLDADHRYIPEIIPLPGSSASLHGFWIYPGRCYRFVTGAVSICKYIGPVGCMVPGKVSGVNAAAPSGAACAWYKADNTEADHAFTNSTYDRAGG